MLSQSLFIQLSSHLFRRAQLSPEIEVILHRFQNRLPKLKLDILTSIITPDESVPKV